LNNAGRTVVNFWCCGLLDLYGLFVLGFRCCGLLDLCGLFFLGFWCYLILNFWDNNLGLFNYCGFWNGLRALAVIVHWLIVIADSNRALRSDKHWATARVVIHAGLTVPARAH
jgi:hypothetical protein